MSREAVGTGANRRAVIKNKKYNKEYYYRINSEGKRIAQSRKGYQEAGTLKKLVFKNGKLTKAGEAYRELLLEGTKGLNGMDKKESTWLLKQFDQYREIRHKQNKDITYESLESHNAEDKLRRMIFNFGATPEDIATEAGIDLEDILSEENWDFKNGEFRIDGELIFKFQYDYEQYNGFKIFRV